MPKNTQQQSSNAPAKESAVRLYVVTDTTTKQVTLAEAATPSGALAMVVRPRFEVHVATPGEVLKLMRDAPETTVLQAKGEQS